MPFTIFALECAPHVDPHTIAEIIRVESAGDPLAINVNSADGPKSLRARDFDHAIALARNAMDQGSTVDLGLMQVNSANFDWLTLDIEDAFDPCRNITAGATVLTHAYRRALATHPPGQTALQVALSIYNTGNHERGFRNGYVARYYGAAPAPALQAAGTKPSNYTIADAAVYSARSTVFKQQNPENIMSNAPNQAFVTSRDPADAVLPGVLVELDPDDPRLFDEDAVSEADAIAANGDLATIDED